MPCYPYKCSNNTYHLTWHGSIMDIYPTVIRGWNNTPSIDIKDRHCRSVPLAKRVIQTCPTANAEPLTLHRYLYKRPSQVPTASRAGDSLTDTSRMALNKISLRVELMVRASGTHVPRSTGIPRSRWGVFMLTRHHFFLCQWEGEQKKQTG